MSSKSPLDQFYTKPAIVDRVLSMVDCSAYDMVIEPSAGAGDFFKRLPPKTRLGIDLQPAAPGIKEKDFLKFEPSITGSILTIGNPPFGKNSSRAVKFFNHAASFSDRIAFIVPRTFRKPTIINRLNSNFHLIKQELLPPDAFYTPTEESYSVPTVFQVWQCRKEPRMRVKSYDFHPDFDFLGTDCYSFTDVEVTIACAPAFYGDNTQEIYTMPKEELQALKDMRKKYPKMFSAHRVTQAKKLLSWETQPDFAWRRAGSRAGEVFRDYKSCPTEGFAFIKVNTKGVVKVFERMWKDVWNPDSNIDRTHEKWDTAGQPSISRHELIKLYIQTKEQHE